MKLNGKINAKWAKKEEREQGADEGKMLAYCGRGDNINFSSELWAWKYGFWD